MTKDKRQSRSIPPASTTEQFNHRLVRVGCNLLALLTNDLLAVETDFVDGGTALTVSLDVLDELGNTEEVIHLLKRQTLGLRDEEPDEEEHGETEGSVDKEGSNCC